MGAAGQQDVLGPFREIGQGREDRGQLAKKDLVGPTDLKKLAGLGDVLRRGPPMHIASRLTRARLIQRPHQWDQGMTGAGESGSDGLQIKVRQPSLAGDLMGGALRDDSQLGLRLRERRLDVEPGLEAGLFREQCAHTRVLDPKGSRFFQHGRFSSG